ncbi:unnamed protein product [Adineta steineri]|uniref:Neural proliferation differentiation and control protein 1 n=2 Tax=Adineta steineri TaxID=433720 RepID=A0A814ZGU8_9BILA|nr:unnamed protein product [Adineta steineri]CAF3676751.1 unnamed protein product [Adineta steineri]CAF3863058.1 unnamed protein product [Adineta steineri]
MMKIFVSSHVVLLILVATTTIDASRIFYLPLPKIHSSKQQIQPPKIIEETTKKPISDEFIPDSVIEQAEFEKRGDTFDWETLVDTAAASKRRITVDELLPKNLEQLKERYLSDELMENKINDDKEETKESIDKVSEVHHENLFEEPWVPDSIIGRAERLQSNAGLRSTKKGQRNDTLFITIVATCCAVGVVGLVGAAIFWYKIQKKAEAAVDSEYPSYGVTGPNSSGSKISPSSTMSDRKLAQSAQMYHYQHQRQQMMAQEKDLLDAKATNSDDSDDEAPAGGDFTVYECPGLAPTGEMEVRNPLFAEPDSSIVSSTNNHYPQASTSPTREKILP